MKDQYEMFPPGTFPATPNAISLPASGYGPQQLAPQGGEMTVPCGLDPVRVSRSARQEVVEGLMIHATSGQSGSGSSASAALTLSLGSRLKARLEGRGSTLYQLTWKEAITPLGRRYSVLRASGRQTSGTDFIGWPTPVVNDAMKGGQITPRAGMICLNAAAQMAGWPPPTVKRESGGATVNPDKVLARALGRHSNDLQDFVQLVAGWATPSARDWRTPNHKAPEDRGRGAKGEQLTNQVAHMIHGASLSGLDVGTGKLGLLNPEFSRWLQGLPETWGKYACTETRSTLSSRGNS